MRYRIDPDTSCGCHATLFNDCDSGYSEFCRSNQSKASMSTDGAYEELLKKMVDFASGYLDPAWKKRKAGENHELPTDTTFVEIFRGFTEIGDALDALALTEDLLRLAPPRSKRIDRDSYLKFLVGSYLQEMYILEQRLTAYAKKLSRLYRRPSLPAAVRRVVFEPLQGLINTRGSHVHQRRFTDESLDRVSTVALFRRAHHELGEDLEFEYKRVQLDWRKRVSKNNNAMRRIVDQYCALVAAVVCHDGKVTLPRIATT